MTYTEDEYLLLSGIQHYSFCRRQWALIHIEQCWNENLLTAEGKIMHERAHDASISEKGEMSLSFMILGLSHLFSASPVPAMWWNSIRVMMEFRCMAGMENGFRILLNTSVASPKKLTQIVYNSADRQCVWKKCCAVKSKKELSITEKPDIVKKFCLMLYLSK